jgi:hypothetical protein
MTLRPAGCALLMMTLPVSIGAHRLDEYLQASLISLSRDRVELQLDLTPGVAVLPIVLAEIDRDGDGAISEAERAAYSAQVLRDLSITADGEPVRLSLLRCRFPEVREIKEGLGVIRLELAGNLPARWFGARRELTFTNRHQERIAAYLVNSLVPPDSAIHITGQSRDVRQSFYRVSYVQNVGRIPLPAWLCGALALLVVRTTVLLRRRRANRARPRCYALPLADFSLWR